MKTENKIIDNKSKEFKTEVEEYLVKWEDEIKLAQRYIESLRVCLHYPKTRSSEICYHLSEHVRYCITRLNLMHDNARGENIRYNRKKESK